MAEKMTQSKPSEGAIEIVERVIRCCSSDCDSPATQTAFWPGQTRPMCDRCVTRAKNIANVMGFTLPTEPIGTLALTRLTGDGWKP